jgi:hypothetical protein
MGHLRLTGIVAATFLLALLAPATGQASPALHECQHPLRTGVEIYDLRAVSPRQACPVALELFGWESSSSAHQRALYGCARPKPEDAGYPFLRLHRFRGWELALKGPEKRFTMSRGSATFSVTGTDFPLNCT